MSVDDPARDFAWWLHATPAVGGRAVAAYGGAPDAGFAARTRLAFVLMALYELEFGLETGRPGFVGSALAALHERVRILGEPR
ncbi:MAG: hypothetical protein ACXWXN_02660 [Actinomycetota bacterium]